MLAYVSATILTGVICLGVAVYALQHENTPGARLFALLMADAALFAFPFAVLAGSSSIELARTWYWLSLPGWTFFAPLWLAFTLKFTNRTTWLAKPIPHLLFLVSFALLLLGWINPNALYAANFRIDSNSLMSHVQVDKGILFWISLVYNGMLLTGGAVLLARTMIKRLHRHHWRLAALFIGFLSPIAGNLLFLSHEIPPLVKGLTPLTGAVTGIFWSVALFYRSSADSFGQVEWIEPDPKHSRQHLEAILNALPDLLFDVDRQGRIHDFRAPEQQMLYIRPEQFLGKRVTDVLPSSGDVIIAALQEAAMQGWHHGAVYSLDYPQGKRWFELSIQAAGNLTDPDIHFIVLVRDISERFQMQEMLRESDERFHNLVKQSRDGIVLTDEQGNIIEWNPSQEQMTGIRAHDALGKPLWDIQFQFLDEEQKNFVSYQMQKDWIESFLQTGEVPFERKILEQQYTLANGKQRTVQSAFFSISSAKGNLLCGFNRDITQQKQSEQTLRYQNTYLEALYDTTLDLISNLDVETLLENIVRRAARSMGTDHGFIDLVETAKEELESKVAIGILQETAIYKTRRGEGLAGKVWQTGRTLAVEDYDHWEGRLPEFAENKIRAMVGIPLLSRSRVIGVLGLAYSTDSNKAFNTEDIHFLEQFARLASVALENVWLFKATNELLEHEQHLKEVSQLLSGSLDLSKTLDTFMHLTVQLVDADAGLLGVFTLDGQKLHYPYRYNIPADFMPPQDLATIEKLRQTGSLARRDRQDVKILPTEIQADWTSAGIHHFIALPVSAGHEQIGVLWLFKLAENKYFSEAQLSLAQAAAQQAALALQNAQRFKGVQTHGLRQAALFRLSTLLAAASNEEKIWQLVADGLHEPHLHYSYVVLLELDPATSERVIRGHVGWSNEWLGKRLAPAQGISERPLLDGQLHYSPDITKEPNYFPGLGKGSEVDVPISIEGELVGVLTVEDEQEYAFASEDLEVFISAANQAGLALGQARLLKRTRKHVGELNSLNEVSRVLHTQLDTDTLVKFVGEQLLKIFNVEGGYISLHDPETNLMHFPFMHQPGGASQIEPIPLAGGFTEVIFQTQKFLLINQNFDQRFAELGGRKISRSTTPNPKSWLGVPILTQNHPVGIMSVLNYQRENAFTEDEVNLLQTLGANLGVAIQNARLYAQLQKELGERQRAEAELLDANQNLMKQLSEIEMLQIQLREQAIRDPLTGLFNRRYLRDTLPREVAQAIRGDYPIGIMIMDLDRFKTINDTHGHDAGDAVLEFMGAFLTCETRAGDIVCRYGGEEIVIVLPGASSEDTQRRAEHIRVSFGSQAIPYQNTTIHAAVSIGVAAFPKDGESGDQVLIKADRALYQAKQNGRNQVRIYEHQVLE